MSSQIVEGFFPALTSALKQRDGVWESMFPSESQLSCPVTTATLRAETDFPITLRWPALFPLLIFGVALGLVQFAVLQSDGISRHFNPGYTVSFIFYGVMCVSAMFVHCLLDAPDLANPNAEDEWLYRKLVSVDAGATLSACVAAIYGAVMPLPGPNGDLPSHIDAHMRTIMNISGGAFWLAFFPAKWTTEVAYLGSIAAALVVVGWRMAASWTHWNVAQRGWIRFMLGSALLVCFGLPLDPFLCSLTGGHINYMSFLFLGCHGIYWGLAGLLLAGVPPEVLAAGENKAD